MSETRAPNALAMVRRAAAVSISPLVKICRARTRGAPAVACARDLEQRRGQRVDAVGREVREHGGDLRGLPEDADATNAPRALERERAFVARCDRVEDSDAIRGAHPGGAARAQLHEIFEHRPRARVVPHAKGLAGGARRARGEPLRRHAPVAERRVSGARSSALVTGASDCRASGSSTSRSALGARGRPRECAQRRTGRAARRRGVRAVDVRRASAARQSRDASRLRRRARRARASRRAAALRAIIERGTDGESAAEPSPK